MTYGQLFMEMHPNVKVIDNGTCIWIFFDDANHDTIRKEWFDQEIPEIAITVSNTIEPRVMTLKETVAMNRNCPIYIELRNDMCGWDIYDGVDIQTTELVTGSLWGPHEYWDLNDYGRKWRCWTSQPSYEQRKAAIW